MYVIFINRMHDEGRERERGSSREGAVEREQERESRAEITGERERDSMFDLCMNVVDNARTNDQCINQCGEREAG